MRHAGGVSAQQADALAQAEFGKYRAERERRRVSDFDELEGRVEGAEA